MSDAADKFTGDEFITYDADAKYPYGFLAVCITGSSFVFSTNVNAVCTFNLFFERLSMGIVVHAAQ